ncbi:MAG: amidohydrolase family protein [Clostridia bacterium]|nr:amidohydrolase family protein [Clostridia bacterium]
MEFTVIDAHVHVYPDKVAARAAENLGKFYNFPIDEAGTLDSLIESERRIGAGGFLMLPVATDAVHVDHINDYTAEYVMKSRGMGFEAYAVGCMHQDYPDFASGVRHIKELGLLGVKLHPDIQREPVDSDRMKKLCEVLENEGLLLFLHAGDKREEYYYSSPDRIARIAEEFPGLRICAAHFGGYSVWDEAEKYLWGRYGNVWYDLSASLQWMTPEKATENIRKAGVGRMMFGSDFPSVSPWKVKDMFEKLDLTPAEREDILCRNARRFLGSEQ